MPVMSSQCQDSHFHWDRRLPVIHESSVQYPDLHQFYISLRLRVIQHVVLFVDPLAADRIFL